MSRHTTCPGCGVVIPRTIGRCPACGHRLSVRGLVKRLLIAAVLVAGLAGATVGLVMWSLAPPGKDGFTENVYVASNGFRPAPDFRQTVVSGTLDNGNTVPVDVTVRAIALDFKDAVVATATLGPYRNLGVGQTLPFRHTLDLTPIKSVRFEVVKARPTIP